MPKQTKRKKKHRTLWQKAKAFAKKGLGTALKISPYVLDALALEVPEIAPALPILDPLLAKAGDILNGRKNSPRVKFTPQERDTALAFVLAECAKNCKREAEARKGKIEYTTPLLLE